MGLRYVCFDLAQDRPFDPDQGRPFDLAQGRPFDPAQGKLGQAQHAAQDACLGASVDSVKGKEVEHAE